jgi:hypothetical protein
MEGAANRRVILEIDDRGDGMIEQRKKKHVTRGA